jgi:isoquinoline 1-oxidoreductase subunit beta
MPGSDTVVEAVHVAKAAGAPVKTMWTREDDLRGGFYCPMWHSTVTAGLDANGAPVAWKHTLVGQSILRGTPFEAAAVKDGIDATSVEGAADLPYALPNVSVDLHSPKGPVPVLWWRSVGHTHTGFVVESFIDELAHAAGKDPYQYRRALLTGHPPAPGPARPGSAAGQLGRPADGRPGSGHRRPRVLRELVRPGGRGLALRPADPCPSRRVRHRLRAAG